MKSIKYSTIQPTSSLGFTLVEIMIVVAIIAILAGIAIPKYADYQEEARVKSSAQEIIALSALIEAYYQEARAYPNSLADVNLAGKVDPWGSTYQYYNILKNGKGGARKDKKLNPLNSDFDMYSMGKDQKSKSQISQKDSLDDVIRANNGGYVDLAEKY
jgi:general secretion pathway protein G